MSDKLNLTDMSDDNLKYLIFEQFKKPRLMNNWETELLKKSSNSQAELKMAKEDLIIRQQPYLIKSREVRWYIHILLFKQFKQKGLVKNWTVFLSSEHKQSCLMKYWEIIAFENITLVARHSIFTLQESNLINKN